MNGAQWAAFLDLTRAAEKMADFLKDVIITEKSCDLATRWYNARNRYFALEVEALAAKSSARKSRGAVRQKAGANQPKNSNV